MRPLSSANGNHHQCPAGVARSMGHLGCCALLHLRIQRRRRDLSGGRRTPRRHPVRTGQSPDRVRRIHCIDMAGCLAELGVSHGGLPGLRNGSHTNAVPLPLFHRLTDQARIAGTLDKFPRTVDRNAEDTERHSQIKPIGQPWFGSNGQGCT